MSRSKNSRRGSRNHGSPGMGLGRERGTRKQAGFDPACFVGKKILRKSERAARRRMDVNSLKEGVE